MRNSSPVFISQAESSPAVEETTWSLPGAVIGFLSWLLALGMPFALYGLNTLFFFLYTWPFFLALMPLAIILGVAMHSILKGRIILSCMATLLSVGLMFGVLLMWLLG